jgi:alkylation response protein AidB-like acyl-CoA dehydrogenase
MPFTLTEEQEMLRASARNFLKQEYDEAAVKEVETGILGYSPELWHRIAGLGWLGLVYPEKYGGSEMNLLDLAVLCEEIGRAAFAGPLISTVVLGGLTILGSGTEKQKSALLPGIIEGSLIISPVLGESKTAFAGLGTPETVAVTAEKDGSAYILSDAGLFIHDANIAHKFIVPARTGKDSVTLFLVHAESPGITVERLASTPDDNQCEVVFNNVRVSADDIIGGLDSGRDSLSRPLHAATVMFAAQMLGAGQDMLQESIDDYENRVRNNEILGVEEFNKKYLDNLKEELDNCREAVYRAAARLDAGESCDFETDIIAAWSNLTLK